MKASVKIIFLLIFACFNLGVSAQRKTPIHVFELGQSITEHLVKTFPCSLVSAAWKVNTNNVLSYEVRMVKRNMEYALIYDKDGKFLRKEVVTPIVEEQKPIVHRKQPKPFLLQQLDSLQKSDSLVLRY
jgi:hypothetical protein